jgi:hypothetical protein
MTSRCLGSSGKKMTCATLGLAEDHLDELWRNFVDVEEFVLQPAEVGVPGGLGRSNAVRAPIVHLEDPENAADLPPPDVARRHEMMLGVLGATRLLQPLAGRALRRRALQQRLERRAQRIGER